MAEKIGVIGSPSTTGSVTMDIVEDASAMPLHGQLVCLSHPLSDGCLIAIATVTEIHTQNRWHEDSNMRGVLKLHGSLPHLSEVGDVRTAELLVQAAYDAATSDPSEGEAPRESGGALSMSPTTGGPVYAVTDEFLGSLLRRHKDEITYLGHLYRSDVRLPLKLKHFGVDPKGGESDKGAGEAYHLGIFGMTGSGKTALATYLVKQVHEQAGVALQPKIRIALELFGPLHNLFAPKNEQGGDRKNLWGVLQRAVERGAKRPVVILDFSKGGSDLLDSTPVKARLLRIVCSRLNTVAEARYQEGESLNTLVVFDEAQRFAAQEPEDDESRDLSVKLVDYVRTTRKYGLGWMFITQETGALRTGIWGQLRVRCFGHGLTSGSELSRLQDVVGDKASVELYRSFVDPGAIDPAQYPFMLTGPVSPLSFTGAPVFLSVYTDFEEFKRDNGVA